MTSVSSRSIRDETLGLQKFWAEPVPTQDKEANYVSANICKPFHVHIEEVIVAT